MMYWNILIIPPQTIATFKLKKTPKPNAYDLNLSGLDRCEENYFTPKIETIGTFQL